MQQSKSILFSASEQDFALTGWNNIQFHYDCNVSERYFSTGKKILTKLLALLVNVFILSRWLFTKVAKSNTSLLAVSIKPTGFLENSQREKIVLATKVWQVYK